VQDTAPGAEVGFVIFVALFDGGVVPDGLEPRRRGLTGYIYTPFRMGDLMREVIRRGESEGLAFTISDMSSGVAKPMYASHDRGAELDPGLTREATLAIAGRQWRIATSALRGFRDSSGAAAAWVAGSLGTMLTAAVMGITFVQSRSRLAERAAAERLERGELRYRSLVAATASIVWTSGPDGSFTEPQASWEAYTGQPWEEHRGRGWLAAVHEPDRARVEEAWSRAAAQGSVLEVDGRIWHRATQSYRWFNLRGVPIARPAGDVAEWVGLIQDIQERRHLEENLLQSRKLESLGRLAGGIAHDFNNLLTAIVGSAELAILDPGLTPSVADYLRTITAAAERSGVLTGHLLSFARRQVIEPRNVSLTELVRGVTPILRRLLGDNIRLTVKVAEDLGVTRIDPGQFEQVLVNLATNARDAMPSGGVLTVETANADLDEEYARTHQGVTAGRYVMLLVADTGVGMDEAVQAHMFEPFFTTKEAGKGTGLGLATCYGIVRQAGGSIWVYSEPGKGTLFRIFLPRVTGQVEAAAAPADEPPSSGTETVLLVEDEPMVAAVAASALRSQGYRVLFASSGEEALAAARGHPGAIDLLVTDVVLPQMNGRELAERLRAVRPQVRVLFCSGYTDSVALPGEAGDSGWRAGAVAFLQKPYTPKLLARRVRAVLDARTPVGN
jgi:PAS domain S-box-containing protein